MSGPSWRKTGDGRDDGALRIAGGGPTVRRSNSTEARPLGRGLRAVLSARLGE